MRWGTDYLLKTFHPYNGRAGGYVIAHQVRSLKDASSCGPLASPVTIIVELLSTCLLVIITAPMFGSKGH